MNGKKVSTAVRARAWVSETGAPMWLCKPISQDPGGGRPFSH
jgi:hypothetical protein